MLKKRMPPTHPGRVLKNLYMEPLYLSQGDVADNLGIARKTLSLLLNEHQDISAILLCQFILTYTRCLP